MRRLALLFQICACLVLQTNGEIALEASHTAASLEEMVIDRAQSSMSGNDAKNFNKLVKKLIGPMRREIKKKRDRSQSLIDKSIKDVAACTDNFRTQVAFAKKATRLFRQQSKKHKACRTKQAQLFKHTKRCVVNAGEQKQNVKLFKGYLKSIKKGNKHRLNERFCKRMRGEEHIEWLKRMRGNMKQMIGKIKSRKKYFKQVKQEKKKKGKGCQVALQAVKKKKKLCDEAGRKMDVYSCNAAVTVEKGCDKLDICYPVALKAYKSLESTTRLQVTDYKVDWRAFDRINCYLGALGKGKAGSSNKKKLAYCKKFKINTSHLDVKFPKIPKKLPCPKAKVYPCNTAYKKAEYDTLPQKARGKCNICEAMNKKKET